jgi:hypothetical protein
MGALAAEQRQAEQERVEREGGVDVQVAEQHLLRARHAERTPGLAIRAHAPLEQLRSAPRPHDLAGPFVSPERPAPGREDDSDCEPRQRTQRQDDLLPHEPAPSPGDTPQWYWNPARPGRAASMGSVAPAR